MQLAGEYTADYYSVGTTRIDLPATKGAITATARVSVRTVLNNEANFVFVFTQTTGGVKNSSNSNISNLQLTKNSNGEIIGKDSGQNSISFKNNALTLTFYNSDPNGVLVVHAIKNN